MTNSKKLHRWNIQGIEPLITLSSTFFLVLLHIAAFQRNRVSMFHERLTHNLHCSEFVELTLIITPSTKFSTPQWPIGQEYLSGMTVISQQEKWKVSTTKLRY